MTDNNNDTVNDRNRIRRNRVVLVLIAALFGLPLVAAWLMQSGKISWRPAETVNLGQLVDPPVALQLQAGAGVDGHWLILYVLPQDCEQSCDEEVTALRQVHKASGRHRDRIAVVLLSDGMPPPLVSDRLLTIYPEFRIAPDRDRLALDRLAEAVGADRDAPEPLARHAFVLDPGANVILAYTAGFNPNHINRDLKRLMTWSAQDE
jgi:hypothetical protein